MAAAREQTRTSRLGALLPGVDQARGYRRAWLRGDVLAGVTVAAYLVPQVMAYAEVAGLPPVTGLWVIMGSLAVYALLGSSRQLSVGPESTTALMTAAAVAPLAAGDPGRYAVLAAGLALVVAALCLLAWIARLGFLADLLSKPVLVGYLAGVAVIMVVSQLGKITGMAVEGDGAMQEVGYVLTSLDQVHGPTLLVAVTVLAFLLVLGRLLPRAPVPLIGMLLAAVAVAVLSLEDVGVTLIGDVPQGLPRPSLPDVTVADLQTLLLPAVGVLLVGYSDNVLTARAFAGRNRYSIDANQELLALGAANLTAGAVQGFPVSSSGSRTVIADAMGARTQLYSLVALGGVVATLLVLGPVLAAFPTAALGALVVYAAIRLVDVAEFRRIARFRRSELLIALTTTVAVLVLGVLYGVLAAVAVSIADLLRRVARPHDGILGYVPGVAGMHDVDDYPQAALLPGLVVYRYDSPLFFANAENFKRRALDAVRTAQPPAQWFVLNVEAVVEIDVTGVDALEEVREELEAAGVVFALARVKQDLAVDLDAAGLTARVGADRIFFTLPTAVHAYLHWYADRHGTPPPGAEAVPPLQRPAGEG